MNMLSIFKKQILLWILICFSINQVAQSQTPALVGYWHNWNTTDAPFIPLNNIDTTYNVIVVSFTVPTSYTDMTMVFVPEQYTTANFITHIQQLQNSGKKVLLSIGGATGVINLADNTQKQNFITSMNNLITTYGFDGIDIDIEHGDCITASGTIVAPTDPGTLNLISAIQSIMTIFEQNHGHKMWLTMAPETAYVQGGMSGYGSIWGGYLPLIHALRNELDIVSVQLYNSGTIYGLDGNIYTQGTTDFIVALTEATIRGFNTAGGFFEGLPASKVAVGLPACVSAAGGGFTDTADVAAAIRYLKGEGTKPGTYTLIEPNGYPDLRGMMTWSINWDAVNCCGAYTFAQNYRNLFLPSVINNVNENHKTYSYYIYPNPANDYLKIVSNNDLLDFKCITITDLNGKVVFSKFIELNQPINIEDLKNGIYFLSINQKNHLKFIVQH
jgi:chitinase